MLRKIDLMHKLFGTADGQCKNCCHLITGRYHDMTLRKCEVYGLTHSAASDWAMRYQACGLFNKETAHEEVIRLVKSKNPSVQEEDVLEGQINFLEVNND